MKPLSNICFRLQAERKPYFYTLSSLDNAVTENHYSLSAAWSDPDKWNGRTAFDIDHFNDKNSISTFSAWVMSPPFKVSIFEFHIGYGFNYSNSNRKSFCCYKDIIGILSTIFIIILRSQEFITLILHLLINYSFCYCINYYTSVEIA